MYSFCRPILIFFNESGLRQCGNHHSQILTCESANPASTPFDPDLSCTHDAVLHQGIDSSIGPSP